MEKFTVQQRAKAVELQKSCSVALTKRANGTHFNPRTAATDLVIRRLVPRFRVDGTVAGVDLQGLLSERGKLLMKIQKHEHGDVGLSLVSQHRLCCYLKRTYTSVELTVKSTLSWN